MKKSNTQRRNSLGSDIYVTENKEWSDLEDGDGDGQQYCYKDGEIALARDVFAYCFKRSFPSWIYLILHLSLFIVSLYGYFFGIVLLGSGSEVLGGC